MIPNCFPPSAFIPFAALFFLTLSPSAVAGESSPAPANIELLPRVLLALAAIIVVGQVIGKLFTRLGQPPVIGEVIAGILLGPSLLGSSVSSFLLPPAVAPVLNIIAQLGVVLFMFLIGLELDLGPSQRRLHAVAWTSVASIVVPLLAGVGLGVVLHPRVASPDVPVLHFALFMGVALAITAFPVLARILTDLGKSRTELGIVALSCAALNDAAAWCLLALLTGVVKSQASDGVYIAGYATLFVAVLGLVVRPLVRRFLPGDPSVPPSRGEVALVFVALLLSALVAETIGIHAIFGAFLFGAIIPHDSPIAKALAHQLENVVGVLLLPAFFAVTGMRTRIDLLADPRAWLICGVIILVATTGKFLGTFLAARCIGFPTRDAAILGTLMNTRGLMELIVLNVGLELGVISPALYAMMVLMAIATTLMTSPIVLLFWRRDEH